MLASFLFGLYWLDVSPQRLIGGLGKLWGFLRLMLPPTANGHALLLVHALFETLAIALLGTLIATVLALPFGLIAARNVVRNEGVHFLVRRLLDTLRSIDTLVWALMWIAVVGLGPFAGVLAIASADFGALGKIFSETIEATEQGPVEAIRSAGGTRLQQIRLGLLPQVLPVIAGQVLYFFESNTRSATIIGIVGAGGIGLHLYEAIRTFEWQEVSFAVLLILIVVALIDAGSGRLRAAMRSPPIGA
jgi:phosphonate transport system permease protein